MKTLSTPHYFACKRLDRTLSIDEDCGPNRMDGLPECVGCGQWERAEAGEGLKRASETFAKQSPDDRSRVQGEALAAVLAAMNGGRTMSPKEIRIKAAFWVNSIGDCLGILEKRGEVVHLGLGRWALSRRQQIGALETEWTRNFTEVGNGTTANSL